MCMHCHQNITISVVQIDTESIDWGEKPQLSHNNVRTNNYFKNYRKFRTISHDFFLTLSTLRLMQGRGLFMDFSSGVLKQK